MHNRKFTRHCMCGVCQLSRLRCRCETCEEHLMRLVLRKLPYLHEKAAPKKHSLLQLAWNQLKG